MAQKDNAFPVILQRLERIESKLFGNGESVLERLSRLEARLGIYEGSAQITLQDEIKAILQEMLAKQSQSNKMQFIGLWLAVLSIVAGYVITKALGGAP